MQSGKQVYELYHIRGSIGHYWSFFSTSQEEAVNHAKEVCKKRGWKYRQVRKISIEPPPQPILPSKDKKMQHIIDEMLLDRTPEDVLQSVMRYLTEREKETDNEDS